MNTPLNEGLSMPTEVLITISQLSAFFTASGVSTKCMQCGAEDWVLVEPPRSMIWAISAFHTDGSVVLPTPSIPVVALCCSKCANLRQHALKPIQQWLNNESDEAVVNHD